MVAVATKAASIVVGFARVVGSSLGAKGAVLWDLVGAGRDDSDEGRAPERQEVFGAPGLYCRPPNDEDEPTEAVVVRLGDEDIPVAAVDRDSIQLANVGAEDPMPRAGQKVFVGYGGAFLSFERRDGAREDDVMLYVPYERNGQRVPGKAHVVTIGKDSGGKQIVELRSGSGAAVTILDDDVVLGKGGGSYVEIKPDGIVLNGSTKIVGGTDIGGEGALPLAKAAEVIAASAAAEAAMSTLAGSLTTLGGGGSAPVVHSEFAAIATAFTTAIATLTAANAALSSTGVTTLTKAV